MVENFVEDANDEHTNENIIEDENMKMKKMTIEIQMRTIMKKI